MGAISGQRQDGADGGNVLERPATQGLNSQPLDSDPPKVKEDSGTGDLAAEEAQAC